MNATNDNRDRLVARLDSLTNRAQAIFAEADDAGRDLTEVELGEVTRLASDADKLRARLDVTEKLGTHDDFLNQSAGRRVLPDGIKNPRSGQILDLSRKPATYSNLFGAPASRHDFRDLHDFVKAAVHGNDMRLMNATMTEGTGAAGGFLVPLQYSQAILDQALESEVIRPNSNVIPMTSATLDLPIFNTTDRTGAARAGLTMVMLSEAGTATAQSAVTANLSLHARKGAVFVDVTSELESDVPGFSNYLGQHMANAIGGGFDYQFVQGTGAGAPLGIVNASCTAVVSKEGSQAADTVLAANLLKMAARLHPSCWARAMWLVSPSVLAQLLSLSQESGPSTGGRAVELTYKDNMLIIMGRPVVITDACSALGDKGDVILADLSAYVIGLRKEMSIERDISSGWKSDLVGFRTIVRFDGMPAWPSAVTPRAGVDTLSAFVVIEDRT